MPIQIPDLDDRNYDQLLNETYGVIARYFPEYAEIGPSDPAMALNELFCFLFDVAVYQQNRITPAAWKNFAALLGIKVEYERSPEDALRQVLAKLSRIERAVTPGDMEVIIKKASADGNICNAPVQRVFVRTTPGEPVQVFIYQNPKALVSVPRKERPMKLQQDVRNLYAFLRERSPLGTRLYLTHAPLLDFDIRAEIVKRLDTTISGDNLKREAQNKLEAFFSPLIGGDKGTGWEFGKAVSRGDIFTLLEGISGVDHVRSLHIKKSNEDSFTALDTLALEEGGLANLKDVSILVR